MAEVYYDILTIPTKALIWSRSKDIKTEKRVVLIIPGNPGIPDCYEKFCRHLFTQLNEDIPIITLGHCGHDDNLQIPILEGSEEFFDIHGQIEHKKEFIRKYLSDDCKITIIGHSIGAYIALKLLEDPEIGKQIEKSYLLFPTFEKMAETRNGKILNFMQNIHAITLFWLWVISLLPTFLLNIVLTIAMLTMGAPFEFLPSFRTMVNFETFLKITHMAYSEMETVKDYDKSAILEFRDKVKFFYGKEDSWVPRSAHVQFKSAYPQLDIEICDENITHAFVLKSAKRMALLVSGWLKQQWHFK